MSNNTRKEYIVNVAVKKSLKKTNLAYYGKIGRYRKAWRIKDIIPLGKYLDVFADFKRSYGILVYGLVLNTVLTFSHVSESSM